MLVEMLALLAAAETAAPQPAAASPPTTVSPLTVSPAPKAPPTAATIDMASDQEGGRSDFTAIWPATAYKAGVDARVTLSCLVDVHGLAERCEVASETPANQGFGRAALELRPTLKLKPATGPDGAPVNATMSIKIRFKAPDLDFDRREMNQELLKMAANPLSAGTMDFNFHGSPLTMRAVTMLDDPVWTQAASFDDVARAYPAKGGGVEGYAAAHCLVERAGAQAGALKGCQIIKESPNGRDFGKAALSLTSRFRVDAAALAKAPRGAPLWVDIPIRLPPPAELADRAVTAPVWIVSLDPKAASRFFPRKATVNGITTGIGIARCTVAADGSMADCEGESGPDDRMDFSDVAARLTSTMKMNLWSADGVPVQGGYVRIPVHFDKDGGAG
jgi:TonB family protein